MHVRVLIVHVEDGKQKYVEYKVTDNGVCVLQTKSSLDFFINYVRSNSLKCDNFIIVRNSYLKGKNCSLKFKEVKSEVLLNDKVGLDCNTRERSNKGALRGAERRVVTKREEWNIRQEEKRKSSSGCIERQDRQRRIHDVDSNGIVILKPCSSSVFKKKFDSAKSIVPFSWCVDSHSIEDYNNMTILYSEGQGFVSVSSDGNIGSVLKEPNGASGFAKTALINAIKHGGDKLDCFAIGNGGLVDMYMQCGFIPVCRLKFNREYAPDGWTLGMEEPDVVFMMHNLDTADDIVKKYGSFVSYKSFLEDNNIPYFDDYDEAGEYRDKLLKESKDKKYSKSLKGRFNILKKALSDIN